ncbi:hypothetical protein [Gaoshiqia sp. Z1-71]|uniref:hypothetical protein n=1 Tax=Gaoshiqia hydrogeniformans TaxID=3290090 RepID=UPI003BF8444E
MKLYIYTIIFVGLLAIHFNPLRAQQVHVRAVIDSTNVLIGDQFNLRLEVDQPKSALVEFPAFGDSLSETVEIVARSPLDTFHLDAGEQIKIIQNLTITSFDTGKHVVPALKFGLKYQNIAQIIESQPAEFYVHGMEIDTTKGPVDIKAPYTAPVTLKEVSPYILGAILIGALIFFLFYYIERRKKNKPVFGWAEKPKDPAHVVALRELDRIKEQKMWQQNQVKLYYSDISDTLRIYIEERFGVQAMEYTTDETIRAFMSQKNLLNEKNFKELKDILSLSDLVKFAKYQPLPDDHNMTLMNAYFFVNDTKAEEKKTIQEKDEREGDDVVLK